MPLFLMLATASLVLAGGVWQTHKLHRQLVPKPVRKRLPQAISMLVIAVQLPELAHILEHISIVHIVAAGLLLAMAMASGNRDDADVRI